MTDELLDEWIAKAEQGYRAARKLDPQDTPDAVGFHCQQCIEKYLKAVMVHSQVKVEKRYGLLELNEMLLTETGDQRLEGLFDQLEALEASAVASRQPGFGAAPEEAERALEVMENLRAQLREML